MVLAESDVKGDRTETRPASDRSDRRRWRIAVCGAASLTSIPWALWEFLMDGTPRGTRILLRRGLKSTPGVFERLIRELASKHAEHLEIEWVMPDPEEGRSQTFNRDNAMVAKSDLVLAFFAPYHAMEGGTGHVVETAIDRNVPVYSWTLSDKGLTRVGDHDPEALWQETVAEYFDRTD